MNCQKCNDTGSLSKSVHGNQDCHYCGRADENVRVLAWFKSVRTDGGDADLLNLYYHGVAAGADLQRARVDELEKEVAANRQQIKQMDRELSAERMVHGATKRLKQQLSDESVKQKRDIDELHDTVAMRDNQIAALKVTPSAADNGGK